MDRIGDILKRLLQYDSTLDGWKQGCRFFLKLDTN